MPTILKIIVYPLFAAFCVVLFSVLLFPFDSVRNRLVLEIERKLGGEYAISIGSLSPASLSGAVLKDVEIRPRGVPKALPVKLSKVKLDFGLFALLSGNWEVDYDLRAGKGRAEGSFSWKKGGIDLDLKMKGFDIGVAGFLAQKAGIAVNGVMNGTVVMEIYPEDPLRNTGKISLEMPDLQVGEINLGGGALMVPTIRLAQEGGPASRIDIQISRGNLEVQQVQFAGGDLDLSATGKVYGARKAENYRFNLQGTFKVSQALADKIPLLMVVEKQKSPDGSYPLTITGRLSNPSIRVGEFKVPI